MDSIAESQVTLFLGQAGSLRRQYASQVAGLAVTIAAAALIGPWAGLPLLSSWGSSFGTVKPMTAVCLAALGLTLMHRGKGSRFAVAVGLAVAFVCALDLFGVDFGINRWLVPQGVVPGPEMTSFQMINGMPLAIGLAGGSLALSRFEGHHFAATALGGLAGVMAAFALLTHLTGIHIRYGWFKPPALPTAVGVLCVASAIALQIKTTPTLRKLRPLWHLLVMLGCAIVAPLLLFGAYAGARVTDEQLRLVRSDLMSEARTIMAEVDREIVGEIERLQALAASPSLRQGDLAAFQHQAEASLALRQSGNIILVDRNMQQLVNTWLSFGEAMPRMTVPEPVEKVLATGKPRVTGLLMRPITKQLMFSIIVPVQIDGENRYALVRSSNQHAHAAMVTANELPPGWLAVVSDAAHRIIARSEREDAFTGQPLPPAQWHRAERAGIFEFVDSEGQPSLQAYVWSELTGWETAVWAPEAALEAPVRALWWTMGVMALLAFVLVVALASWLGRIIAGSVGHAARAAIALGEGGPLPPLGTSVAEVDTLIAELRRTAAKRRAAEELLREGKDRLQLALDAAQLGWWEYDPLCRVLLWDGRAREICDYAENELTIEQFLKQIHPDDAARFSAVREASLDPADPKSYRSEYRIVRRDGKVRWVESCGRAYFDGPERRRLVSFVGTIQDITDRKEREEKEHLLMREINHRAKNMLSVVHAIARQTAAKNSEHFVERFSERIQALSANHNLLVRNEWNGVEIEDLVRAQLAPFADLIGSRIAALGPKLRFKAASAQAIGLVLHELATNAGKYGALSTDKGRVNVCWGIEGDTLTMSWTERDGPPVSAPERRGFGTMVMEAMAEHSVDGSVDLDYAPSGLTWRLTSLVTNVLEPS